ncbi:hypothetical protein EMIT0P44_10268 [Pseudomonas sp. IT-P44]
MGVDAPAVTVEVHWANGLPSLIMVGLPEAALSKRINKFLTAHMRPVYKGERPEKRRGVFVRNPCLTSNAS